MLPVVYLLIILPLHSNATSGPAAKPTELDFLILGGRGFDVI